MIRSHKRIIIVLLIVTLSMPCTGCKQFIQQVIDMVTNGGGGGGGGFLPPNIGTSFPPPPSGTGTTTTVAPPSTGTLNPPTSQTPPATNPETIPPLTDSNVPFFKYPVQRSNRKNHGARFADYETHCPPRFGTQYWDSDPMTHAHETTHGINSDIRNNYNRTGRKANGFYCGNDRGLVLVEPNIRIAQACAYVPNSLKGMRYNLYMVQQRSGWDDCPLYIFDELTAYTNGGEVGVDMAKSGTLNKNCDGVRGALEFTVYSTAIAMAIAAYDKQYFESYKPFRAFLKWSLTRAMTVHYAGRNLPQFSGYNQVQYLESLRSGPEAENMRAFLKKACGEDWFNKVIMGQ